MIKGVSVMLVECHLLHVELSFFIWTYTRYKICKSAESLGVLCAEIVVNDKLLQAFEIY